MANIKPKVQYLVVYDVNDSDPVAVFDTLDRAKQFVAALFAHDQDKADSLNAYVRENVSVDDVTLSSIKVYEGVLIGKPKVEITFDK